MWGGGGVLGGKLPYILSDLKRSRKSNQMLSNTILMSTENVKFYQPGPTFPGSIRKSIYRGYIPKNLVPSVRAHEEPGPKCPGSIRKSFDRVYLPKNLVPSVRAHGENGEEGAQMFKKVYSLYSAFYPSLRFTLSLHFTPGPQSAVCSPQSAFYTDRIINGELGSSFKSCPTPIVENSNL